MLDVEVAPLEMLVEESLPGVDAVRVVSVEAEVVVGDESEASEGAPEVPSTTAPPHATVATPMSPDSRRFEVLVIMAHMVPLTSPALEPVELRETDVLPTGAWFGEPDVPASADAVTPPPRTG